MRSKVIARLSIGPEACDFTVGSVGVLEVGDAAPFRYSVQVVGGMLPGGHDSAEFTDKGAALDYAFRVALEHVREVLL